MSSYRKVEELKMFATCPECERSIGINANNFSQWCSPCDVCGSHDHLEVTVLCTSCNLVFDYVIRET